MHDFVLAGQMLATALGVIAIFWWFRAQDELPTGRGPHRVSIVLWGSVALGAAAFALLSIKLSSPPEAFWDFLRAYYPAGRAALHHDAAGLKALIGEGVGGGFVNIPAVAYLFAPFAVCPPKVAAVLFTALGIGSTVAAWFLLVRLAALAPRERWLLALLFLANGPLLSGIKWANISYVLIFMLAAGLALIHSKRSLAAGLLLGVAAVLKPALVLFGLFFLLRRDWRGAFGFALMGVVTVIMSLGLFGWSSNLYWLQTSILQYSHNWLAVSGNQSIPAFLARLSASPAILLDFSVTKPDAGLKLVSQVITGMIFLVAAVACYRPRAAGAAEDLRDKAGAAERCTLQYLLTICLCLVGSPLSWAHYYAWALIPTAFFLGGRPAPLASKPARVLGWVAIALVTPLVLWPRAMGNTELDVFYTSVVVSHHLFGGLLWFGLIAWWLAASRGRLAQVRGVPAQRTASSMS